LVKSDGQLRPRLVKLAENPQLTETLDYVVHDGHQVVGRWTPDATSDILLRGPLIAQSHWSVDSHYGNNSKVIVTRGLAL